MYKGNWSWIDTSIEVSFKVVAEVSMPIDSVEKHEQIKVFYNSLDTLLFFKSELYVRTRKYDKISQKAIEEYKKISDKRN